MSPLDDTRTFAELRRLVAAEVAEARGKARTARWLGTFFLMLGLGLLLWLWAVLPG
jgi:hypothetical protein